MDTLYVPITLRQVEPKELERTLKTLHSVKPDIVFIGISAVSCDAGRRRETLGKLTEGVKSLKREGFTVGVWTWSFMIAEKENPFTHITAGTGQVNPNEACPSDEAYLSYMGERIAELARTGPDMIFLDDDYCYGYGTREELGCFCGNHLKDVSRRLNENVSREFLLGQVLSGGTNKYRVAWQDSKRDAMENFALRMRKAVDSVDPSIRMGLCSTLNAWDVDGTDCIRLAKLLAGRTKPFLRFCGAPYWVTAVLDNRLIDVIELNRLQAAWCEGEGIETASEGDTCPRPRYSCPASYLEIFHTALAADGKETGILKYMLDYSAAADYEEGYVRFHLENRKLRDELCEIFSGKEDAGIRIFEHMHKMRDADAAAGDGREIPLGVDLMFSKASMLMSQHSIPTNYTRDSRLLTVFGENARTVPDARKHDFILDLWAADHLREQGIDTGLKKIGKALSAGEAGMLYYPRESSAAAVNGPVSAYRAELDPDCRVILYYGGGPDGIPAAYVYRNGAGQRFFVLLYDSRTTGRLAGRNYLYQKALLEGIGAVSDEKLPAVCPNNPDLYVLAKRRGNQLAVGLWNCFEDPVLNRGVRLPGKVNSVRFVNCTGSFRGEEVRIDGLPPFGIAAFEAEIEE